MKQRGMLQKEGKSLELELYCILTARILKGGSQTMLNSIANSWGHGYDGYVFLSGLMADEESTVVYYAAMYGYDGQVWHQEEQEHYNRHLLDLSSLPEWMKLQAKLSMV